MNQVKRKIWIVSFYTTSPQYDSHMRHQRFLQNLTERGYDVTIVNGSYMHAKNIDFMDVPGTYQERTYDGMKYIHIRTVKYTSNGLKRMFAIFQFAWRLLQVCKNFERPDVILHNAHVPFDVLVYRVARKLKAKYICEVWDLWPESFVSFGLVGKKNLLLKWAYAVEKRLYRKADRLIFTMEGGKEYLLEKKWQDVVDLNKVTYINNGVDLAAFDADREQHQLEDPDLKDPEMIRIVYLGAIRLANGLKELMDAAALLKQYSKIRFLIYGDGTERAELEAYCAANGIDNVLFKEKWISLEQVPYVLSCSYVNMLNYRQNDMQRFGSSSGKLFQYLASGKPICSNQVIKFDPILDHQLGVAATFKTAAEYAEAILSLVQMDAKDYAAMGERARKVASMYDYKVLTERLVSVLETV
jgi:glycosyltransferase involved in cell wall biosynthesis